MATILILFSGKTDCFPWQAHASLTGSKVVGRGHATYHMNVSCLQWFSFHAPWTLCWDCTLHSVAGEVAALARRSVFLCTAVGAIRLQWHGKWGPVFPVSNVLRLLITQLPLSYISFKCRNLVNKIKILWWGRNCFPQWAHGLALSPLPYNQMSHHQFQCFPSPVRNLPYSCITWLVVYKLGEEVMLDQ